MDQDDRFHFERGAIRPLQCLSEGWHVIKEQYWFFLGVTLVGVLVAGLAPFYILMGPAMCGIHICLLRQANGQRVSFDMLFQGFNYFGQSLLATMFFMVPELILTVIYFVFYFAFLFGLIAQGQGGPPPVEWLLAFGGITLVFVLLSLAIQIPFFFIYPLIVDREMTGVEAVKTSIRAVFANLGGVLAVLFLEFLLSLIGVLACYVGAIFVLPITMAMTMVAFRQVFPRIDPFAEMAADMREDAEPPPAPVVVSDDVGIQVREPRPTGMQERPPHEPGPATS